MRTEAKKNKIDGFSKNNKKKGDGPLKIFKILQIMVIFGPMLNVDFWNQFDWKIIIGLWQRESVKWEYFEYFLGQMSLCESETADNGNLQ